MAADEGDSIRALARGLAVLQAINRLAPATITEVARAVGLPHPTAIRILNTLAELGFITREPAGKRYRPTGLVASLASGFQDHDRLVQAARTPIVALTQAVGWPLSVVTRVGRQMVTRDTTAALTSLTFTSYGGGVLMPIFGSAAGEVWFAFSSLAEQAEMLAYVDEEEPDVARLAAFRSGELPALIRAQGYAVGTRNPRPSGTAGVLSIAVPILVDETLVGALALVFFARAMSVEEAARRYLEPLQAAAAATALDLSADGADRRT